MDNARALYLVHFDAESELANAPPVDAVQLAPGLYLAESSQTRSQVYHAWKRRHDPKRLLVAPLAGVPKFKGMAPGALAWIRARDAR
jgi:hypothetical protein